jgi:hypothetical protein
VTFCQNRDRAARGKKKAKNQRSRLAARTTHTAEPVVPVRVLGLVPVPVRGAQVLGLVVEGAPAQHAGVAFVIYLTIVIVFVTLIVVLVIRVTILYPLPDIAVHIV